MNFKQLILAVSVLLSPFISTLQAHDDLEKYYHLTSTDIMSVFAGKTLHSINQRKKTEVLTYLSKDGTMKQSIKTSNTQRKGKWHAANHQLCLRWQKHDSEYCFDKILFHDEVFFLLKNDQVETIVKKIDEGDKTGF